MVIFNGKEYPHTEIAILLATYNGEKYLIEQLNSLLNQTCSNFICFIHDDGSTDGTPQIIDEYCRKYPQFFILVKGKPCGSSKMNFMFLLNEIKADYIMFCDQDDVWLNDKVMKSLSAIKEMEREYGKGTPFCVYSDLKIVDKNLIVISKSYFLYTKKDPYANSLIDLLKENVVVGCTMLINSQLQQLSLKVKSIDNIFMHDWWCALICATEGKFSFINEPLILYRQHDNNSVGAKKKNSVLKKMKNLSNIKKWISIYQNQIKRQRDFARELVTIISDKNTDYIFLLNLSNINKEKWKNRVSFYANNNLYFKYKNKLLQIIFI